MQLLALLLLGAAAQAAPPEVPATPPVGAAQCVACRVAIAEPSTLYSREQWQALGSGEILRETHSGSADAARARAVGLIARAPRQVWAVLTDFESWPGFMPHVTRTQITRRAGGRLWVHQDFRVMLVGMEHTTVYEPQPQSGRLKWSLDTAQHHDIAASEGAWELVPIDDGRQTLVRYSSAMDAGRAVPDFVKDLLLRRSLEGLFQGLRSEVLRRSPDSAD